MLEKMPRLNDLFFAVCSTAIQNTSWKYADFEKVKVVEGQLAALHQFFVEFYKEEKPEVLGELEKVDGVPIKEIVKPEEPVKKKDEEPIKQPEAKPTSEAATVEKIISPEEAKKVEPRQMPDEILEAVKVGMEVAKHPPKVAPVKVDELPADPDAAREIFDKPF
jgi:hypothetical protein